MKIPGLKLSKGESYTDSWGSEDEIEQPHHHQHPSLEGNGQHHLSPRSSNNDHLPPQSTVQSYGNIKMKSKNLMCHLISPRSYSKFQKEEEERERRQRVAASGTRWDQDDEDFHSRARVAPVHPNDATTLDQVWLGFEEQTAPSEAYVERRKYQQAAAIDYYMKNGQQIGGEVETPEELARMAGPKVIRTAANGDAEAIGDENEQCLEWVRYEQRRGETRSRSLSTGNKYDTNSKYIAKPIKHKSSNKHHKKGDERPMLRYY
ncbi:uncharacterized protein ACA1_264700 [Acanthamoeba castellanii str. Neff]|uniref:Uncharacterized protein n=1 Tax=Acanthamoeba castellanii (strain ATCC 30010 / Neff) TaxID=1257118 RepID=L8H4A9_ACACF|nr:uncharacterized protein ACA1_264700 [Acanthamoeba castellanii str. Neff]ELR19296.1 hypothetical protein ACA1_264700 [Acanthamoeba castellanii str. Neff]